MQRWHSLFLPRSARSVAWLAILIVFAISFLALVGWLLDITLLKGIRSQWIRMSVITASCLILSAVELALLQESPAGVRQSVVLRAPGILVGLVGSLTIVLYAIAMITGKEPSLGSVPFVALFWDPVTRMALLTAILFLILGSALVLLATGGRRAAHIAHALMVPAAMASYLVPVSYLLGVQSLLESFNVAVALHTGTAFCALSIAIFCVHPDTWLMRVFTGDHAGGVMARRLLPGLLLIPLLIGWLRLYGERAGAFESEVGVALVAVAYTFCLLWLVWMTARSVNKTDDRRRQTDEALRKERDFVSAVLDTEGALVVVLDRQGRITRFNRACEEITGYPAAEVLGRVVWEFLIPPEELPGVRETWEALKAGDFPSTYENHWLVKDGSQRLIAWSNTTLTSGTGEVEHIIGTGIDVTDHKQAEEALLRAKEAWERTFASVPDLIAILDNQHQVMRVNEAMARRLGVKAEEAIGLRCYEVVHGLSEPPDFCPHSRTIKDGRQHIEEVHEERLGGDFVVSTTPLHDDRGQMIGTVHVAHDITKRKRAEETLQKAHDELELRVRERTAALSEAVDALHDEINERRKVEEDLARQAELLNLTHDAIIARDLNQRVFFWNRGAEERYGWFSDEVRGKVTDSLLQTVYPQPRQEIEEDLLLRGRWEGELIHTTRNGRKIIVASRRALRRDKDGKPIAILEINSDITEQKHIEEQLRQAQKMEAIGTLAGGIAHDFNNMLAAIIGNAELAMDDVPEEMTARHNLDQIFKAGMRARGLVRQILTFSRKTEQEHKPLPLTPLVNETFKLLRSSLPTTIEMRLNVETSSDVVLADPIQMQQVLMNLCTNAADAMRHTGGRFEITLADTVFGEGGPLPEAGMRPGAYVSLTASDTGPGMDEDVKSRIFEPFFTTKERGQGTGMGLAVVYGIVKSHKGVMTVLSQPGQGATFTVYLPRYTSAEKADEPSSRPAPKGKERILFVDDEELLVEIAEETLGRLGYRVLGTTDSVHALQTFAEDPGAFDLVITDQTMPQMTGTVLAQKLKELRPDIPLILCTGYSETISQEKAESIGIHGFLMKPLSTNELAETIRRVLDTKANR